MEENKRRKITINQLKYRNECLNRIRSKWLECYILLVKRH